MFSQAQVAVLIGFSGVGKSYLAKAFHHFEVIDTDRYIAENYFKSALKQLFLELPAGADRKPVLEKIEAAERRFLEEWDPKPKSQTIIAAGPAIPTRMPHWQSFLERTAATVLYLKATPELIEKRLLHRQENELSKYRGHPNAQAWNVGISSEFVHNGYRRLPLHEIRSNIRIRLEANQPYYEKFANRTFNCELLENATGQEIEEFRNSVMAALT